MSETDLHEVEHQIKIDAPASEVYRLIAEVQNWPRLFPPTVFVDHVEKSAGSERIRIWATANGEVKSWTSRRVLDPVAMTVGFRQEVSSPPVAAMGGLWLIEAISDAQTLVRLRHDYRAIDDDPANVDWIAQAVDRNSNSELAALKANVEAGVDAEQGLVFSFEDSVAIDGAASDAYDFLNQAQLWRERLPHVARVVLTEDVAGIQVLEMDTQTRDGSAHTTKSIRVCFPKTKIVYKQITLPSLMTCHTGCWTVAENPEGLLVTSQHTVAINEANIAAVLGPEADVARAREFVRDALGGNSRATLGHAKDYAESRR